ncbi:uncharacterized protein LOC117641164 [Thrips palmi]|uniref:Uncharacterized protein LOC117641164 n=1 Tax=Thrips palmi TaxID=161013 RepID=A0A6P8YJT0_THRPL|nr:uncharacterized protein LOC117641164 [Thrips palmi]
MARHVAVLLLAVAALAALAAASPEGKGRPHDIQRRNIRHFFHNIKMKVKIHLDINKLKNCLKSTPGVSQAVKNTVLGCSGSAAGGMGAIAGCAARKAAIPAARATAHLAVCMG